MVFSGRVLRSDYLLLSRDSSTRLIGLLEIIIFRAIRPSASNSNISRERSLARSAYAD